MRCLSFSLAIVGALLFGTAANAGSLGVNFGADAAGGGDPVLQPTDTAGVVSQANWNNAQGTGATITDAMDDSGAATTADVTWAASESWSIGTPATSEGRLMNGWLSSNTPGVASTVSVAEIPYDIYDLYVYVGHDRSPGRTVFNELGGAITDFTTSEDVTNDTLAEDPFVYNQIVNSGDSGNYFRVRALTQSTLEIEFSHPDDTRAPFAGLQIVEIPEPATALLIGMGALMLGFVTRRRS